MKFRQHREMLDEAMLTVVELAPTKAALAAHLTSLGGYGLGRTKGVWVEDITVQPYGGIDTRTGWSTHIVTVRGSAVGFTDGPAT